MTRTCVLALALCIPHASIAANAEADYSARLDALWRFEEPRESEVRFRAEVAAHARGTREAAEAATQVARALGLQRRFREADSVLDALRPTLSHLPVRVRVRYLLERGRRDNSSGHPTKALVWFEQALAASTEDGLPGADYYRVDALHMLAIAAPPARRLGWNLHALAAADASVDARTRGWRASLLNNTGWVMHERGDDVAALAYWQDALAAREATHDVAGTRIARWTVARGLRAIGRLDEAETIQRRLADEFAADHMPDGYVFEELAEIADARGDHVAAQTWAAKALPLLRDDVDLRNSEPARLARLEALARLSGGH